MHKDTESQFQIYSTTIAELNGTSDVTKMFNVDPNQEQLLEEKIEESYDFLGKINIYPVDQIKGQKIGIGSSGPIAGRTDVEGGEERKPGSNHSMYPSEYELFEVEYDSFLKWAKLDAWRHKPNFSELVSTAVTKQIASDRIMIGWHGTSAAAGTDKAANPLLQDVNKGWIKIQTDARPESIMSAIKIGNQADSTYNNLDAAVADVKAKLIGAQHRQNPDLVVVMSWDLLNSKYLALINSYDAPTEREALAAMVSNIKVGGLPVEIVPHFPDDAFAITTLDNLSIYWQRESQRRQVIDNPKRKGIEDFRTINEGYVVEDHELFAGATGILLPDGEGAWV